MEPHDVERLVDDKVGAILLYANKRCFVVLYVMSKDSYFIVDTNLIDSCQAHLPMRFALNIELIRQM